MRNVATSKGIALDKVLNDKLTVKHVHEHRHVVEVMDELQRLIPPRYEADGEAEELPAGELPPAA